MRLTTEMTELGAGGRDRTGSFGVERRLQPGWAASSHLQTTKLGGVSPDL